MLAGQVLIGERGSGLEGLSKVLRPSLSGGSSSLDKVREWEALLEKGSPPF